MSGPLVLLNDDLFGVLLEYMDGRALYDSLRITRSRWVWTRTQKSKGRMGLSWTWMLINVYHVFWRSRLVATGLCAWEGLVIAGRASQACVIVAGTVVPDGRLTDDPRSARLVGVNWCTRCQHMDVHHKGAEFVSCICGNPMF